VIELTGHSGICGFVTAIRTSAEDGQTVATDYETTCPHAEKARAALKSVDAYTELFRKPHETAVYAALSPHLPHTPARCTPAFSRPSRPRRGSRCRRMSR